MWKTLSVRRRRRRRRRRRSPPFPGPSPSSAPANAKFSNAVVEWKGRPHRVVSRWGFGVPAQFWDSRPSPRTSRATGASGVPRDRAATDRALRLLGGYREVTARPAAATVSGLQAPPRWRPPVAVRRGLPGSRSPWLPRRLFFGRRPSLEGPAGPARARRRAMFAPRCFSASGSLGPACSGWRGSPIASAVRSRVPLALAAAMFASPPQGSWARGFRLLRLLLQSALFPLDLSAASVCPVPARGGPPVPLFFWLSRVSRRGPWGLCSGLPSAAAPLSGRCPPEEKEEEEEEEEEECKPKCHQRCWN